jgi:large subunit ribosomal protein L5
MNITMVTSTESDKEAFSLLEKMGMPFTKGSTNG